MDSATYEKAIGTLLLIAGLAVIAYSINLGVNAFIKGQNPPEIFKQADLSADLPKSTASASEKSLPKNLNEMNPEDLQKLISDNIMTPEAMRSIIPPEMFSYVPRMLNLSVLSIFLWILIVAGAKVSSLGIALIKINTAVKL